MSTLEETIAENAAAPQEVEADGVRVRSKTLTEQIAADKYLKGTTSAEAGMRGMRLTRLVPPGAV